MNKRNHYYLAVLVLILTLLVFLPAVRNDFVNWDDFDYAYDNYHLRSLNWSFFQWAFTDISLAGYWYPLVWTSHAIDYAIWGLNPLGHHLTSILLHALNAFFVTVLIIKLLTAAKMAGTHVDYSPWLDERSTLIAAGVTGILFGIHPLHVEPAVWISDRKDLLSTLFFLLSILSYADFAHGIKDNESSGKPWSFIRSNKYRLSLAFFVLSVSCKTVAVTLPVVLLLLDWYPFNRFTTRQGRYAALSEKVPFLAGSLFITIVSFIGQKAFGALSYLEDTGLLTRIIVAFKALAMYLWKTVVPTDLVPFYPYPEQVSLLTLEYITPIFLAGAITAGCLLSVKQRPVLLALWGYYVISVAPALGLIPVGTHYLADRYVYLPSLGLFLFAGLGAAWIWMKAGTAKQNSRLIKGIALLTAAVFILTLSLLTIKQTGVWKNSIIFWSYVIEKEGDHVPVAYNNRGLAYLTAGQPDLALADHTKAIMLKPDYADYYNNRGVVFWKTGQLSLAMQDFEKAIAVEPRFPEAYVNRGMLFKDRGEAGRAFEDLSTAIMLNTTRDAAYYVRGQILQEAGQVGAAIEDFSAVLALNPYHPEAYNNRGLLFAQAGQLDHAMTDFDRAIRINPSSVEAYTNRGLLSEGQGRLGEAIQDYSWAIKLNPADSANYHNRGIALDKMGRVEEALADFTAAIFLAPDAGQLYLDRGELYRKAGRENLARNDYHKACVLGVRAGCGRGNR